jgi:hypothetical protein
MFILSIVSLLVVPALAVPTLHTGCNLSHAKLSVPENQTALTTPTSAPSYIALGVGVQNYTCNATSLTYSSVGAVAELFDVSCLYGTHEFSKIQDDSYTFWSQAPPSVTAQEIITKLGSSPPVLGQHYFVPNPNPAPGSPALSPKWDFTSGAKKGNPQAFVIGAKTGDIPAPSGKNDIDWLQLKKVQGELADVLYRVATKAGQPPASCTAGSPLLSVKYTSLYYFFGGTVTK